MRHSLLYLPIFTELVHGANKSSVGGLSDAGIRFCGKEHRDIREMLIRHSSCTLPAIHAPLLTSSSGVFLVSLPLQVRNHE